MSTRARPYHEPDIITVLIQSSFLLCLNIVGHLLDNSIYCGLIGQILIGVAYGTPGAQILSPEFEIVTTNLGYIGLILVVFEGGLSTSISALKANIYLSFLVATTGVLLPIAFSFSLLSLTNATPLQAFAAGCALCSTSLGTTFTVLKTTGLTNSRLGAVLTSAAMLDDVVGLVMVQVISSLGRRDSSFNASTVLRPVFVSVAYAVCIPLSLVLLGRPVIARLASNAKVERSTVQRWIRSPNVIFLMTMLLLLGMVVGAGYAGTSGLFASYLVGASVSWVDEQVQKQPGQIAEQPVTEASDSPERATCDSLATSSTRSAGSVLRHEQIPEPKPDILEATSNGVLTGQQERRRQIAQATSCQKLERSISQTSQQPVQSGSLEVGRILSGIEVYERYLLVVVERILKPMFFASIGYAIPVAQMFSGHIVWRGLVYGILMTIGKLFCGIWLIRFAAIKQTSSGVSAKAKNITSKFPRPRSMYPACLLGCAMVARGEIGFLISAVAQASGVFGSTSNDGSSDTFMVVTWAILLCTIGGPITVGLMAKRIRRLQSQERASAAGKESPLGIWGISDK